MSQESKTPETDRQPYPQCGEVVSKDFARTLEEQRDAARTQVASLTAKLAEARKDGERIEKLRWYVVNVRQPMRHGSLNIFYASPGDGDEEDVTPSDLREQIDALPPAPTERA